ncbi:hypothetical protein V8E54_009548 [Elaphomyces granulatus]
MHFNTIHVLCFFCVLLAGGMASPIAENSLEPRGHLPPPKLPGCPGVQGNPGPVNQVNQCSTGTPFCCSPTNSGGHNCVKADVSCKQTVLCCNNNNGVQICMGGTDVNIDMPITINF